MKTPKLIFRSTLFFAFISFSNILWGQLPYKDPLLPVDVRVQDLISRMTLTEKISQLGNTTPAINRLGIHAYEYWSEALHGVARAGLATSFPQAIALSSTWNPQLIYQIGTAISDEARVKNNTEGKGLSYWSPTINMARDPRWGRAEENYGEDPFLASSIAVSFIKGMQGNDPKYLKTIATAKHFACNNIERNRYGISSEVDQRSLREYYLPAFKASVEEGGVFSVMSAYNAVNGVPSPANRTLLINILRNEWKFKGYVVSDCDAVANVWDSHRYVRTAPEAVAISLLNGTDLNCGTTYPSQGNNSVNRGILKETEIDIALTRIFTARFLTGEFDPPTQVIYTSIPDSLLDCQKHRDLALRAARESIVLLKNQDSLLPIKADSLLKIAVIGPNANMVQLGGYSGSPSVSISPLAGIAQKLGITIIQDRIEAEWFSQQQGIQTESCIEGGSNVGWIESGDYLYFPGLDFKNGQNKIDFRIASNTSGGNINVILDDLSNTPSLTVSTGGTGGWQNWTTITSDIPEITGEHGVYLKFTGTTGYLLNLNWFKVYNPLDTIKDPEQDRLFFAEGCSINGPRDQNAFDSAVNLASIADYAILVCGTDLSVSDEGFDRSSLDIPGVQGELIQAVRNANPNTILVLVTGFSLSVTWANDSVPAILSAWYGGQAQGTAIADVIFGDFNPRGKLSTTWFRSADDLPPMDDYDIKNNRTYMYFKGTPLYPFGHGLSFTRFEYSNLEISKEILDSGDSVVIRAMIRNTGNMAGEEVVQLYIHSPSDHVRPLKNLHGFQGIFLNPGDSGYVEFVVKHESLAMYDTQLREFVVEEADCNILIGSSSEDIRLTGNVHSAEGSVGRTYRFDPLLLMEAEYFEGKSKTVKLSPCETEGICIDSLVHQSYIVFRNYEFLSEPEQFNARLSSLNDGAMIEIRLDSLTGTLAGVLNIISTGGWNNYETQYCEISKVQGVRDVYLIFKTGSTKACKLDWISFSQYLGADPDTKISGSALDISLFPNPAGTDFTLRYYLPGKSFSKLEIFTTQGTLVYHDFIASQPSGKHEWKITCPESMKSEGIYLLKVTNDYFSKSLMLSVLK